MTDEELQHLYALRDSMAGGFQPIAAAAPATEPPSFFGRLGRGIGNFVTDIPHDAASAVTNLLDSFTGTPEVIRRDTRQQVAQSRMDWQPFNIPPAREGNWTDAGADGLSDLARTVAEAYMVGGPVTRVSQLLGAGRAAPIIGDIAGGMFIGAQQSPGEALGTGAEFGALGAANQFLPNPWLKALANVAVPVTGQLMRGHDPTSKESLVSTGANVAVPLLLGQYARRAEQPLMRSAEAEPNFTMGAGTEPRWMPEGATSRSLVPTESSPVYVGPGNNFTMPDGGTQWIEPRPIMRQTAPGPPLALPAPMRLLNAPEAIIAGYGDAQPQPAKLSIPDEVLTSPDGGAGMLRRANNGGFAINPLTQYLGGAAGGAVAGPMLDDSDRPIWEKAALGAAGGLATVAAGRGLMRGFDPEGRLGMLGVPEGRKWWQRPAEAPKEFTPEEYARLADERRETKSKTTPTTPTPAEANAIRTAYNEIRAKSDFPAVSIADVLERAGFTPATMDRGRGIVAAMRQAGDVNLSSGDWSIADPRMRSWAVDLFDSTPTNPQPKQLLMRMGDAPAKAVARMYEAVNGEKIVVTPSAQQPGKYQATYLLRDGEPAGHLTANSAEEAAARVEARDPEIFGASTPEFKRSGGGMMRKDPRQGTLDLSNPAFQYGAGALAGGIAGPVLDQDPDHPFAAKVLIGAGLGALGSKSLFKAAETIGGRSLMRPATPSASPTASTPQTATQTQGGGLMRRSAAAQERGETSKLGYVARVLEKQFDLGKPADVKLAQEQGRGEANLMRKQQQEPARILRDASDADKAAAAQFFTTKRTEADASLLRSSASPEVADAAIALSDVKQSGQKLQFEATDDPQKRALFSSTPEYQAQHYAAFENPKEWQRQLAADPNLKKNYVQQLVRDDVLPGFEPWEVEQAVNAYKVGVMKGDDFSGSSNSSKISRHLVTHLKDLSPEHKAFLGEYKDPVQREILTVHKLIGSAAQAKTISSLAEMGGRGDLTIMDDATRRAEMKTAMASGNEARKSELADLVRIPDNPAFGKLANKLVPRSVRDALNAQGDVWQGGWMRNFSGATSLMKQALTVDNPATHARQWLQTLLLAPIARVAPWDFIKAHRELKSNPALEEELIRNHIKGADVSSQDILRGALEMDTVHNPSKVGRTLGALKSAQGFLQKIYGLPDNLVRVTAYIKNKPRFFAEGNSKGLKGAELERYAQAEATKWVNDHTMNYGAVPNIVKIARNTPFVSPFVSYQAEMTRILGVLGREAISGSGADRAWAVGNLGALIAAPLLVAAAAKKSLSPKDQADWEKTQRLSPQYAGGQIRVPLSRKADGTFRYLNVANLVPAGDTAAFARNLAAGDISSILASNPIIGWEKTPVLNLAADQIAGRDLSTDRKFTGAGDRLVNAVSTVLPPWVPPNYEGQRILRSFQANEDGGMGVTNARTGRTDTPELTLLRNLGGIAVSDVQPRQLMRRAQADQLEKEAAIKAEMRQVLGTNASEETKAAARRQGLMRLKQSREEFRRLMR